MAVVLWQQYEYYYYYHRVGRLYKDERCFPLTQYITNKYNESTEVQTLGVIRIQLIYSINVLSKYSSLISHRPSIFEGRHIDLRRSTHRDIDRLSSKGDTSIFESCHIDFRRSKAETSHLQFATEYCPQLPSKSLE